MEILGGIDGSQWVITQGNVIVDSRIDVPQLRGQECAQRLHRTLVNMNGVVSDGLFLEPGSVRVTYDSMRLALKNLEYAIAAEGFQANDIPPDPAARERLPERCR